MLTHYCKRIGSSFCGQSEFDIDKGTTDPKIVTCERCINKLLDEVPDIYCESLENGECISDDPRCIHQPTPLYMTTKHYGGYSMIISGPPTTLEQANAVAEMHKSSKGYFRGNAFVRVWKLVSEERLIPHKKKKS